MTSFAALGCGAMAGMFFPRAVNAEVVVDKGALKGSYKVFDFTNPMPQGKDNVVYRTMKSRFSQHPGSGLKTEVGRSWGTPLFGTPEAMEMWRAEIKKAGIDAVLVANPYDSGFDAEASVESRYDPLFKIQDSYKDKVWIAGRVNIDQEMSKTLAEVDAGAAKGVRIFRMAPGFRSQAQGGPTFINDPVFYPLFEILISHDVPLMLWSSPLAGPNYAWSTNMLHYDEVCKKFPKMKFVLQHGGMPFAIEAYACAVNNPNLYLSPDGTIFGPGSVDAQAAISRLPEQYMFGTSFPLVDMSEAVAATLKFPFNKSTMENYLYNNAARLLKIDRSQ